MGLEIKLNSLYICVKDMDRAISFYEQFLDQKVTVRDPLFSIFGIKGFRFCLFNNDKANEQVNWGDNCLPSFEVSNINELLERLKELESQIVFPLTKIGSNWVLEFKDSENNDIEVYCRI